VLPAVRASFNHYTTSCLRDGMMLLLASGSTNNREKASKIAQFSTKKRLTTIKYTVASHGVYFRFPLIFRQNNGIM
jgi:hypothetical protein